MESPVSPSSETNDVQLAQHISLPTPSYRRPSENLPEVVPEPAITTYRTTTHDSLPAYGFAEAFDLQHRLSVKGRDQRKPSSPGLVSIWDGEGAKEVYTPTAPDVQREYFDKDDSPASSHSRRRKDERRYPPGVFGYTGSDDNYEKEYCGLKKKWFFTLVALAVVVLLGIALGVGLGVGLTKAKNSASSRTPDDGEYLIGGAISPKYFATTGAFNGSGIAVASQSFSSSTSNGNSGALVMYFQHWTGEIRFMELTTSGDWVGGTPSEIVAVDAKNSTPISAVSYSVNGSDTWHIFYVDQNNTIKQRSNSNTSLVWIDGEINDANLTVNDADQIGFQACWYGNDYGDSNYAHTPLPGGNGTFNKEYGMRIWYASDDTTFKQYGWRYGDGSWSAEGDFNELNGHAGVGCYTWGPGTVTYVMFVNTANEVEIYWRDTNTSLSSTPKHPINKWTKAPITIRDVDPATSLGYTNFLYAQMNDTHMMHGYNITWDAENTAFAPNNEFTVQGNPGIPGTALSVTAVPDADGGNSILVFYQTVGDDVTEFTRDLVQGQWTSASVAIPQR